MDTNALKKFAQAARNLLIGQITSKLDVVADPASPARRQHPLAMKALDAAIARDGKRQVIEQVAYTWFNRFTALRFMDANGYTNTRVVSPADGATRPELLAEAMAGNLPEGAPTSIATLLGDHTSSSDPQAEAYRQLLVHACNTWHGPMPFLFEKIDDYTELLMPEDLLSQTSILSELRKVMTEDACQDVEIIGWLYQFYISEKKDQVFAGLKKNVKITAENIPAATQLFTPHWIVRYLVENSLGRLWLLNRPHSRLAERMDYYIAPEEPETDFLKITKPEDIRICDPAAGSGHMLTYAFDLLYAIYEEEGYDATEIPALILKHNLTGVEIDDRAGALAAFALAMKAAAKLGRRRFLRMEAKPDICVLSDVAFTEAEVVRDVAAVVGKDLFTGELRETLGQFEQAKNFGSLIVPKLRDPAEALRVVEARDFGGDLLLKDVQARVVAVLRMAEALTPKYHVVVANPPYAGSSGLNPILTDWAKKNYPLGKSDLFSMFIERIPNALLPNAYFGMVTLPSWMFLSSYQDLRAEMIHNTPFTSLLHLGRGIFGVDWGSSAFVCRKASSIQQKSDFFRLHQRTFQYLDKDHIGQLFLAAKKDANSAYDFDTYDTKNFKPSEVRSMELCVGNAQRLRYSTDSEKLLKIPGSPIAYWISQGMMGVFENSLPFSDEFDPKQGLATGDNDRFLRYAHEVNRNDIDFQQSSYSSFKSEKRWFPYSKGGSPRRWFGNSELVLDWQDNGRDLKSFKDKNGNLRSRPQNMNYLFRSAVTWSLTSSSDMALCVRYRPCGFTFDINGMSAFPVDSGRFSLNFAAAMLNSTVCQEALKYINPTLAYQSGDIAKVPFPDIEIDYPEEQIVERLISLSKFDWDAYETSWDFTTLPLLQPDYRGETLEATYTALRTDWQGMTSEMQRLEEENNRIFIDAYGLQDELTAEVPLNEITLTCNPAYRYGIKNDAAANEARLRADTMAEFLSYAVGCMFGRYSLDAPGLILANQRETLADYLARIPEPSFMPDEDNVIPVLDADWFPDDITERFRLFLRTTFGEAHFRENLRTIEDALGKDIRKYFTKDFYADHVKRYKKRPIYWMVSSPKGTFNALIYMHRYRGDTVSVILNDYLREFISKLQAERGRLEKLSDDPSASQGQRTKALKDVAVVVKQIDELNAWERDVVFPLAQQKIEIDLDDGVKANYPKLGTALKKIAGLEATDD
tara:strand:- start:10418 stop:14029 length:3612 start_codon:yes stop_codon:yes gene_type:complete